MFFYNILCIAINLRKRFRDNDNVEVLFSASDGPTSLSEYQAGQPNAKFCGRALLVGFWGPLEANGGEPLDAVF